MLREFVLIGSFCAPFVLFGRFVSPTNYSLYSAGLRIMHSLYSAGYCNSLQAGVLLKLNDFAEAHIP